MTSYRCSCGAQRVTGSILLPVNAAPLIEDEVQDLARLMPEKYGCTPEILPLNSDENSFDALLLEECIDKMHVQVTGAGFDSSNHTFYAAHGYVIGSGLNLYRALDVISMERRLHGGDYRLAFMSKYALADAPEHQKRPGWWALYDDHDFMQCSVQYERDDSGRLLEIYLFKNPFA